MIIHAEFIRKCWDKEHFPPAYIVWPDDATGWKCPKCGHFTPISTLKVTC